MMKGFKPPARSVIGGILVALVLAFFVGRFTAPSSSCLPEQIAERKCPPCRCEQFRANEELQAKSSGEQVGAAGPEHGDPGKKKVALSASSPSASSSSSSVSSASSSDSLASLIENTAVNKWVMIAESNSGFHNMTVSFLAHLQNARPEIKNVVVFALDKKEHETLQFLGVPSIFDNQEFHVGAAEFRQKGYDDIVYKKLHILLQTLKLGYNALLSDVDVVWLRNPFLFIETLPECMLYFYCDTDPVQIPSCTELNTGMLFVRSNPKTIDLVEKVIKAPRVGHDQDTFNSILRQFPKKLADPLFGQCSSLGEITYQHLSLPEFLFGGFRRFFGGPQERGFPKKKLSDHSFQQPFGIHFNWLGNYAQKKREMVELNLWRDDFKPVKKP